MTEMVRHHPRFANLGTQGESRASASFVCPAGVLERVDLVRAHTGGGKALAVKTTPDATN